MPHNKVYVICEDKCWEEGVTRQEAFRTDDKEQRSLIPCNEETITSSATFTSDMTRTFRKGDKILIDTMCINHHNSGIIAYVSDGENLTQIGVALCSAQDVWNTDEITVNTSCRGNLVLEFNPRGEFTYKNIVHVSRPSLYSQSKVGDFDVFPKSVSVSTKSMVPEVIQIENREELRFIDEPVTDAITLKPINFDDDYYAMVIIKTAFEKTISAGEFVQGCKVINDDLDITKFSAVHISLYFDGIKICATVSGYE